jgi:hypothetical protein
MDNSCSNSVSAPQDVIGLILEGGEGFLNRVKSLHQAREEHDKAFKALQLGRQTKNALQEAERDKAQAHKVLLDAGKRADQIVAAAKAEADSYSQRVVAEANEVKAAVEAFAEQTRRDTEAWVISTKADLVAKVAQLKEAVRAIGF